MKSSRHLFKILGFLFLFFTHVAAAQGGLLVFGKSIAYFEGAKVTLSIVYPHNSIFDYKKVKQTTIVKNNRFVFNLDVQTAESYNMEMLFKNGKRLSKSLFLEPGSVTIRLNDSTLTNLTIEGNQGALDHARFMQMVTIPASVIQLKAKRDSLNTLQDTLSLPMVKKEFAEQYNQMLKDWAGIAVQWVRAHPNSTINPFVIKRFVDEYFPEDSIKGLVALLPAQSLEGSYGKELCYMLKHLSVGSTLPQLTARDTTGKTIGLADIKGRYILVDFWASWCRPCREGHPQLLKLYDSYHTKGFNILSVSLDKNEKAWKEAIIKDGLYWTQGTEGTRRNQIERSFGIKSLPSNFLIDHKGIIIAKNISVRELATLLNQIYGSH